MADYKPVPAMPAEYLIAANKKAVADRETYGSPDIPVSIVSALADRISSQDVLAVMHRLYGGKTQKH
jgi:hypothetical protein